MPTMDIDLARAARDGDEGSVALLLQQNMAAMRAVAISRLGYVDEAEDAVQDAVVVALRKLPELRDPAAAGPWLREVVRNICRMRLRARHTVPVADPEPLMPADDAADPARALDDDATLDWVRQAVASLPEPTREVTLLRYFTAHSAYSSYEKIAEMCSVPVSTVRSRLRDGRRALERTLRETAEQAYPEAGALAAESRQVAGAIIEAGARGDLERFVRDRFHPDLSLIVSGYLNGDLEDMLALTEATYGAGVGLRLENATASRDVMVWETAFVNPPWDPEHCPPGMVWMHSLREGRVQRLRLAYEVA